MIIIFFLFAKFNFKHKCRITALALSRLYFSLMADKVFGPHATSQEVYEVAAKPVVKAAMEGVNGI